MSPVGHRMVEPQEETLESDPEQQQHAAAIPAPHALLEVSQKGIIATPRRTVPTRSNDRKTVGKLQPDCFHPHRPPGSLETNIADAWIHGVAHDLCFCDTITQSLFGAAQRAKWDILPKPWHSVVEPLALSKGRPVAHAVGGRWRQTFGDYRYEWSGGTYLCALYRTDSSRASSVKQWNLMIIGTHQGNAGLWQNCHGVCLVDGQGAPVYIPAECYFTF